MAKDDEPKKPDDTADGAGPMLDMSQAGVRKMIATAKARGYITYDELNEVLPPEQVTSEQIEDVMAMLSEMGINVIDNDEAEEEERFVLIGTSARLRVLVVSHTYRARDQVIRLISARRADRSERRTYETRWKR